MSIASLSSKIKPGILNFPGASAASKAVTEKLLKLDEQSHHCFFTPVGLHNHLSHHLLAAYDLGAPAELIQAIYDDEAKIQRPIDLKTNGHGAAPEDIPKPGFINDTNWTEHVGNPKAYWAFLEFFAGKVNALGIKKTFEEYIFSPRANGNNTDMLVRFSAGLLHPLIQAGYGIEFDCEIQFASGLAQAAVHTFASDSFFPLHDFIDQDPPSASKGRQPRFGPSVLLLLRQIYDEKDLVPPLPYDPDALISKRRQAYLEGGVRPAALKRILQHFDPGHTKEDIESCLEEIIVVVTFLAFGTSKPNRKPRVDFFLMHLLTGALFLQSTVHAVTGNIEYQRALLRIYIQVLGQTVLLRGRPRIDPALLSSYTADPRPPPSTQAAAGHTVPKAHDEALGSDNRNPWIALVESSLHAPDAHVPKSLRTLIYATQKWGTYGKGEFIGTWGSDGHETHKGISEADGTIFVRAAGVLLDALGWVAHGQKPGNWDRSALGWDDAWNNED